MPLSWKEQLEPALIKQWGLPQGKALYKKYKNAFHAVYYEESTLEMTISDISHLEQLSSEQPSAIEFYEITEKNKPSLHLRLFQYQDLIPLSDSLPIFHNMDLRTFDEYPFEVALPHISSFISDFSVSPMTKAPINLEKIRPIFQDAFTQIMNGASENDGFNKLVLRAGLTWQEITVLRAYAKYLQQTAFRFSHTYIEETVANHAVIAKDLVQLFKLKFDTHRQSSRQKHIAEIEETILKELDSIKSLDEDRIMRNFFLLIRATLRTNYFMSGKMSLALKFKSEDVPDLPLPHPLYEIFIYSPRFEGIHLRGAKVARGGIRWSERREDFRTEVLGLMKAQRVKNAVIVPSGAKGGFVLKMPTKTKENVVESYKTFVHGLLDITDNIKDGIMIHPKQVICYDDYDPYLVVAADKGTGSFSDIANEIANEYQFWLGDAFASGGSSGYNHKEMGITARGAWESIKRHLREANLDIEKNTITAVGIGDMSGDVFGNGLVYSPNVKLVAAFDSRDIFIDPTPDTEKAFEERVRLFQLPTSSWQDYNHKLISKGGGVFSRSFKSNTLIQ